MCCTWSPFHSARNPSNSPHRNLAASVYDEDQSMPDIPIIDALFSALINNDKDALDDIESQRAAECAFLRAVICTDAPGAIDLELGLSVASSEYVTPFFEGTRAFFMSAGASLQARLTGGRSNALIDFSLSFDSNFAEKMRAAIAGENIQRVDRDRVNEVLMLKARNRNVQFDVLPFLIENTRLTRDNPRNERPLNTLIAFRMLDHLDWGAFRDDPSHFVFDVPCEELKASLRSEAVAFLSELQTSGDVIHHEARSAGTQALLLRFARLWHEKRKPDKKRILRELLSFSIYHLGSIPLTELHLIWSGMAWDMTLLRILEKNATASRLGSFFIPYFVSIDQRWRHLLRLNPVTMMLIDDSHRRVLFARADELTFQRILEECVKTELQAEMTPEKVEARRRAAQTAQLGAMQQLVAEEENLWLEQASQQMASKTR